MVIIFLQVNNSFLRFTFYFKINYHKNTFLKYYTLKYFTGAKNTRAYNKKSYFSVDGFNDFISLLYIAFK